MVDLALLKNEEVPGLSTQERDQVLQAIYARGDQIISRFVLAHLAIAVALGFFYETWLITLTVGPAAAAMFLVSVKLLPRSFFTRVMAGVSLQTFVALHIYQLHGLAEMHFFFFTAFTMMIIYCDWLAMWPGALLIIGQHIVFAILHNSGVNLFFFENAYVGFTKLFFHFGIAIVQVILCGFWAVQFRRRALWDAARCQQIAESRERLAEQKKILDSILASVGEAVVVANARGQVIVHNSAAVDLFGPHDPDLPLEGWAARHGFYQSDETTMLRPDEAPLTRALGGASFDEAEIFMRPQGSEQGVWLSVSGRPMREEGGAVRGGVIVCRNITGRKEAERALAESESRLRQAQKMDAIGQLAGGIAHDFNNLLTVIMGYSSLILEDPDPRSVRQSAEEICGAVTLATGLANRLLAFSRKQVTRPEPMDLNSLVANLSCMLQRLIPEDIRTEFQLSPTLDTVIVDLGQIEQALLNLVLNARDAMAGGGVLTIETANVHLTRPEDAAAHDVPPGRYVMLVVQDSGCGIDPQIRGRIFEPFFTTKPQGKGTGLGLSIVYGTVEASHGHIRVASEPGVGSTFRVYLPAAGTRSSAGEAPVADDPSQVVGIETVMVIEDEPALRSLVIKVLAANGYQTLEAANGEEALRIASRYRAFIDLVISDVVMPRMRGPEVIARLRRLLPDVRVLYMSGYADNALSYLRDRDPEAPFLAKPFLPDALLRKVREVLSLVPPSPAGSVIRSGPPWSSTGLALSGI